jgi:heme/copper-type cytochrome/quinol oxidase subunit 3
VGDGLDHRHGSRVVRVPVVQLFLPGVPVPIALAAVRAAGAQALAAQHDHSHPVEHRVGLIFIIIQGIEWSNQPFGARDGAFGSLFYTITGFHGAHVVVGLLMNILVQIWAARGTFTRESHLAVTNAGMYWHFVDVVWLFVFASLYISPRLG